LAPSVRRATLRGVKALLRAVASVARNTRLGRVLLGYAVFNAAQNAVWIAMLVYAYGRGGAATAGLVAVAQLVPAALFAPAAATIADRHSPSQLLTGGYAVQAAGMLAAAAGIAAGVPTAAYAGAVVASTALVTTRPASSVLVPSLVRDAGELTAANALTGWIESVTTVLSSAVTGILLAVAGPGAVFAAAGAAGLIPLALAATVRGTGRLAAAGDEETAGGLAELLAGFRLLRRRDSPRVVLALLGAHWVVIGALDLLFVVLAVDVLRRGEGWAGYLAMAYGLGGILAGPAGMALVGRRHLARPIMAAVALVGVPLALTAGMGSATMTVGLLAAVGGGRVLLNVATRTLLQRTVPAEVVGRVFGLAEGLSMAGLALGSAVVPLLVAAGGPAAALLGAAAVLPLVALLGARALVALDRGAHVPLVEIALLRSIDMFRVLPAPALEGLAHALEPVELVAGDVLIREGDEGDRYYAIASGMLDITVGDHLVASRGRGDGVGEIALLYDRPRTATVTASTAASVFALSSEPFLAAVTGHAATRQAAARVADERLKRSDPPGQR
jgi:CRP-like cAMP-binding protein